MKIAFLPFISPPLKALAHILILFVLLISFMLTVLQQAVEQNQPGKERPVKQLHKKKPPVKYYKKKGQPIKFYPPKHGIA